MEKDGNKVRRRGSQRGIKKEEDKNGGGGRTIKRGGEKMV